jgi:hypothetical protein
MESSTTKKRGRPKKIVQDENYVSGDQNGYSATQQNCEKFLDREGLVVPDSDIDKPSVSTSAIIDLPGIGLTSVPRLVKSSPFNAPKKAPVEIPIADKNFVENFPCDSSPDGEPEDSVSNDLAKLVDYDTLDANLIRAKAELCKKDFAYFIREFWDEINTEKCIWNWHIDYIAG